MGLWGAMLVFGWVMLGVNLNNLSKNEWTGFWAWFSTSASFGVIMWACTNALIYGVGAE